jgi:phage shock protein PspC (stress-responsive transcriptional regulator)
MQRRLYRSDNKLLGGVCAGIAEYFDVDVTLIRIAYLVISVLSAAFPGILIYLILWIIMPDRP